MNRQLFEYHPIIGYKFIPDLRTRVAHEAGGYLVRTNNWGFRSEIDFYKEKSSPHHKRILIFGDSFTAGDGVSNRFRFSDLLQAERDDLEIYNFAIPGTGTDQHYLVYREFANEVEADLIMIFVLVENIRRVNARYRCYLDDKLEQVVYQKPYFESTEGNLRLRNTPVRKEPLRLDELDPGEQERVDRGGRLEPLRKVVKMAGMQDLAQKLLHYQPLPEYGSRSNPEWVLMKQVLAEWVDAIGATPTILVPLPLYQYIEGTSDPKPYQSRFAEAAAELNVSLLDPLTDLQAYSKQEKRGFRFAKDIHLTPAGHMAVFKSIVKGIAGVI